MRLSLYAFNWYVLVSFVQLLQIFSVPAWLFLVNVSASRGKPLVEELYQQGDRFVVWVSTYFWPCIIYNVVAWSLVLTGILNLIIGHFYVISYLCNIIYNLLFRFIFLYIYMCIPYIPLDYDLNEFLSPGTIYKIMYLKMYIHCKITYIRYFLINNNE